MAAVTIPRRVRPIALCVPRREGDILVMVGHDPATGQTFYRPLGGGIEFGETGQAAAVRELREELGAEVVEVRYLGTVENIFVFNGQPGHEIALLYEGRLTDPALNQASELVGREEWQGQVATFRVVWMPLADFEAGLAVLYPPGLLAMLTGGAPCAS